MRLKLNFCYTEAGWSCSISYLSLAEEADSQTFLPPCFSGGKKVCHEYFAFMV